MRLIVLWGHPDVKTQTFTTPSISGSERAENKIIIKEVYPLRERASLVSYLQSRAIPFRVADLYCKAVNYELYKKQYFAVGFQNRSGGYELRNPFFKCASSPKDITHFTNSSKTLSLFEGFMDFLSAIVGKEVLPLKGDYLILNSINLLEKNIPLISEYSEIVSFLDNDTAGKKGILKLQTTGLNVIECINLLQGR